MDRPRAGPADVAGPGPARAATRAGAGPGRAAAGEWPPGRSLRVLRGTVPRAAPACPRRPWWHRRPPPPLARRVTPANRPLSPAPRPGPSWRGLHPGSLSFPFFLIYKKEATIRHCSQTNPSGDTAPRLVSGSLGCTWHRGDGARGARAGRDRVLCAPHARQPGRGGGGTASRPPLARNPGGN